MVAAGLGLLALVEAVAIGGLLTTRPPDPVIPEASPCGSNLQALATSSWSMAARSASPRSSYASIPPLRRQSAC